MLVRTQTPITSAAIAVPTPKGTAVLLTVIHLLITTPQPLILEMPSQKLRTAFHISVFSLCPQICLCNQLFPVTGFLIVFPDDVPNEIMNLWDRMCEFSFCTNGTESTRKRLESTLPRNHEDHIAERGFNSLTHYTLVNKFSDAPSDENSGCESSSA